MSTIRLTMAQALIRFLDQQYISVDGTLTKFIEGVLGIFGHGNVTGLGEALEFESHGLKFIRGSNEQGMVHTATAFAKQKNRKQIMAVTSSIGPGATNMITGAATATINRIPVLLLPGDIFSCRQPDPVLQQLEHPLSHQISVNDCFRPVSRYWDRIDRPEQLMMALIKAMKVLTCPMQAGAVTICLPQDVQCESYDYDVEFFKKRIHTFERIIPSPKKITEAASMLARSERPLIIAGGGIHYSEGAAILQEMAEKLGIPVSETHAGKGAILPESSVFLGGIGVIGTACANRLAKKADCILAIGTRCMDFVTSSKTLFQRDKTKLISINVDGFDVAKLEPACEIRADAKLSLTELYRLLAEQKYRASDLYQKEVCEERQAWFEERVKVLSFANSDDPFFSQTQVLGCLNEVCSQNTVVVGAAGSLPGDMQRLWHAKERKGYHLEYGYSCMGYEVAGGLGVKLAEPEREVWVLVGDGSFLMMHSELVTAISEGVKINILLFDSGGFSCIKGLQCTHGSKGFGTDLRFRNLENNKLDGPILSINFSQYAAALGIKTWSVTHQDDLKKTLLLAKEHRGSTLVEVKVRPGSQSHGYDTFWRVEVSGVSRSPDVLVAQKEMAQQIKTANSY